MAPKWCRGASHASRLLLACVLSGVVVATSLTVASASPPTISSTRAQVDRLEAVLADQQRRSEALSQNYDAIQSRLATLDWRIRHMRDRIRRVHNHVAAVGRQLQGDAVLAYIYGSEDARTVALFTQNATQSDARAVYEQTVIGDISSVEASYKHQGLILGSDQRNLRSQRGAVAAATAQAAALLYQSHALEVRTNAVVASMSARLRHLVLEAAIAAARRAAQEQSAAAAAAASGAAGVAGQLGGSQGTIAATRGFAGSISGSATGSHAGMAALAAAETQIGVAYSWGGESPNVGFDCSGLTQWAWAAAGMSIPRTAAAQWYSLPHVSLEALQPGDLLFYFNLDGDSTVDHVVMYAGSGPFGAQTTIAASHSGTDISLQPAFTYGLIGAARP